jgi:hypothetical protein
MPANRVFFVLNLEFNRIDCKVRVFPCTVIPCREYIFFAVYGVRDLFSSADSGPSQSALCRTHYEPAFCEDWKVKIFL